MWFYVGMVIWWAIGTSSMLWLSRGNDLTWGGLLLCLALGLSGPVLWVIIGVAIFIMADFWSKPIFPQKREKTPPGQRPQAGSS
jgi:hypothetical protein